MEWSAYTLLLGGRMPGCLAASPVHAFCTMPSNLGATACSTAADLVDTESCCARQHRALLFPYMCFCCQFLHWCWGHEQQQHPSHPPPWPPPTFAQSLPLESVTTDEWNTSSELPVDLGHYASSAVVDGRLQVVTYDPDAYDAEDPQYLLVGGA